MKKLSEQSLRKSGTQESSSEIIAVAGVENEIGFVTRENVVALSVRPLAPQDFDQFINYWLALSPAEIERLGVASDRLPSADRMRSDLEAMLAAADENVRSFVLAWCVNGEAIGHSSLKDIVPGESGSMHLHMWRADLRGKGLGAHLFCLSAVDLYKRFKLKRIICEPKADNPPPNRLLQRIGFPLVSTRVGRGSELGTICKLSCYHIVREIAEDYLLTHDAEQTTLQMR